MAGLSYIDWLEERIKKVRYYKVTDSEGVTIQVHCKEGDHDFEDAYIEAGFSWLDKSEAPDGFFFHEIGYAEFKKEQERLQEIDKFLDSFKAFEDYKTKVKILCREMKEEAQKAWGS